jgi:hypothetical protein
MIFATRKPVSVASAKAMSAGFISRLTLMLSLPRGSAQ